MTDFSAEKTLIERLARELGTEAAAALVARAAKAVGTPDAVAHLATLLDELDEMSAKAANAAIHALPELDQRAGLSEVIPWLDLGIALAESSGAAALRYFKHSPVILGLLDGTDARTTVLTIGLEAADRDANVALEYLRVAPDILRTVPVHEVRRWLDIGIELVAVDAVVGLEYIRHIAQVAAVLQADEARTWVAFGMKLVTPNTFGKPDYLAVIEFMRTSPALLGDIRHPDVRSQAISVGVMLAERSPESGIAWLAESPRLLRGIPSVEQQILVLRYGVLLAEQDAEAALLYLRRCPDIVSLIGEDPQARSRFDAWFKAGMEVLAYSREGARAYFGMESRNALASVERAMSGVPLRQVTRRIKFFVEGLCGTDVAIAALPELPDASGSRATVSADGRTIFLPAMLRRSAAPEENERWYLVMAAHEAGHLEFGTYRLGLESLTDLMEDVRRRYGRTDQPIPDTLAALFELYPQPGLVRDLWTVLEDARVEFLLQEEYPGLRRDLTQLAAQAVAPRDPAEGVTVRELMVDGLLRLSTGESADSAVPHAVKEEVSVLWALCRPLFRTTATAEDVVRLTHDLYVRMEELAASRADLMEKDGTTDDSRAQQPTDMYRPLTDHAYRGAMNPEFITWDLKSTEQADGEEAEWDRNAGAGGDASDRPSSGQGARRRDRETEDNGALAGGRSLPSLVEEVLSLDMEQPPMSRSVAHDAREARYPEWDHAIQDYRVNWCRVIERPADAGSDECVDATLASHRSVVRSLRRFFEGLRPPAFRRVSGQAEGEDPDIDAVVRRAAELRAGLEGSDRLYIRREKRERDVAAAFLVDVSGSTGRRLDSGRRVIEVEKESLVLLCEALEAVGDQYALYAYSGQGRAAVDFLTIKDFDDRLDSAAAHRLGGLGPRQQNRDGAAIRHASAKLLARGAKSRILILVSDGRPMDGEYKEEYALEDTKAALREARQRGIEPFCVTVDREAAGYLRRMYGEVRFVVIDRAESLPSRLPHLYRRLTA